MLTIFAPTREYEGCVLFHTSLSMAAFSDESPQRYKIYFTWTPDLAIGPLPLIDYPLRILTLFGNLIIFLNQN